LAERRFSDTLHWVNQRTKRQGQPYAAKYAPDRLINAAHTFTHYSLMVLPTAALAMAAPGGAFGESYGPILALATGMFVL
jgi:hypothetical protein